MTHSNREDKQVIPELCQQCGLSKRTSGSMTSWIFNAQLCSCEGSYEGNLDGEGGDSEPPQIILNERYAIKNFIGQGGISNVYKAVDIETNKVVAIKMVRPEFGKEELAIKRLLQEAEMATRLIHRNLITVWGYGQDRSGLPYIVMDFISGDTLEVFLKNRRHQLSQQEILRVFMQIGQGLKCAHAHGIIHRDLKPSNIIIEMLPSGVATAKIIDFGFSKLTRSSNDDARLTQTGEAFGSPAYMSPEHCLGQELDPRSDIYSFGCVMYEILTGRAPLSGKNVLATIANQVSAQPSLPKDYNSEISESLQNVVMRCLCKEPVRRYQNVSDLLDDLQRVKVGQVVEATGGAKRAKREINRSLGVPSDKRGWLIGFSLLVAVIFVCEIFGAVFMLKKSQPSDATATNTAPVPSTVKNSASQLPSRPEPVSTASEKTPNPNRIRAQKVQSKAKIDKPKASGWDELRNLREFK
ncbi:MAG: serine/threonine-protein kinase [Candidatus Obscuribacterales bacterium]|nr:serine/threonine-protein kinase [Candidatus Obscuribacterales bacterium]